MPIAGDYHMHTPLCHHATGPMEAYVEQALALGLAEIGFSDHAPLPHGLGADVRMGESELDYYVERVTDLRYRYRGRISVLLGLEVDYVEGLESWCRALLDRHPWDYVIGSVHYLDRECRQSAWPRQYTGDVRALYARYFALLRQLARSGLCDFVAHFDIPKRSGFPPGPAEAGDVAASLREIARAGLGIEINTSGFRHSELAEREPYPGWPTVAQARALEIPLVVNSDAHAPHQVGAQFPEVAASLRKMGCQKLARFEARNRIPYEF